MAITIIGGDFSDNGGDGIRMRGVEDATIMNVRTAGNGGNGLSILSSTSILKDLGFPEGTDPKEAAELLSQLIDTTEPQRAEIEKSNSLLQRVGATGVNITNFVASLCTITATPAVHDLIQQLMR
ncbi:right-handed parallel beta-helix repeat-containing protein [Chromobacterium vaccinii]|nr:right-handed parallel beta-helix repeat-containing protein [Chromobacterium vaccinii]